MTLDCGHRCPSLCGETCPKGYCQECGHREDNRVDLLEFKTYKEIDLDETPIVVIDCGHFFTAESVDRLVSMGQVYQADGEGRYTGLSKPSEMLAVPCCPDCKRPIRQFATRRFNRIVDMAVMDETAKKFRIQGEAELEGFRKRAAEAEQSLRDSQATFLLTQRDLEVKTAAVAEGGAKYSTSVSRRYAVWRILEDNITKFCSRMGTEQQPSKKLHDAIIKAKEKQPLESRLARLTVNDNTHITIPAPDNQIILHAQQLLLSVRMSILQDQVAVVERLPGDAAVKAAFNIPERVSTLLKCYVSLTQRATENKLMRVIV